MTVEELQQVFKEAEKNQIKNLYSKKRLRRSLRS